MSDKFLSISGLKKHFGNNRVLDGIDLEIERASITTIIGKSGIGKSVLLKCIANLVLADEGRIQLDGRPIIQSRKTARQPGGVCFSYMFQNNALFDSMTISENISMPLLETTSMSTHELHDEVEGMLGRLELGDVSSSYPAELSGGMRKRVALGRALITKPQIVLFDEPTTGLDPERKFSVLEMIANYRKQFGFTALLVSHDIPEVFEISDRVAWLDQGTLRFIGKPEELELSADLELSRFLDMANYGRNKTEYEGINNK